MLVCRKILFHRKTRPASQISGIRYLNKTNLLWNSHHSVMVLYSNVCLKLWFSRWNWGGGGGGGVFNQYVGTHGTEHGERQTHNWSYLTWTRWFRPCWYFGDIFPSHYNMKNEGIRSIPVCQWGMWKPVWIWTISFFEDHKALLCVFPNIFSVAGCIIPFFMP